MRQRLQDVHLRVYLCLLRLTHAFHVNLAPGHLNAFFLIVTLENGLECAMTQLLVELQRAEKVTSSRSGSIVRRGTYPRVSAIRRFLDDLFVRIVVGRKRSRH